MSSLKCGMNLSEKNKSTLRDWTLRGFLSLPTGIVLEILVGWLTTPVFGDTAWHQAVFSSDPNVVVVRLMFFHLIGWFVILLDWDNIVADGVVSDTSDFVIETEDFVISGRIRIE